MVTEQNEDTMTASDEVVPPPTPEQARRSGLPPTVWLVVAVIALSVLVAIAVRLLQRSHAEHELAEHTEQTAVPTVAVTHPIAASQATEIALPGNVQAFTDTPIYARTSGYLRRWYFDIGAHVRKGQMLATIESPEVDQQLQQAQANLKSAQANLDLANTTKTRYVDLLKSNSVSKQETDQAVSNASAQQAGVDAALANVRRLQQMQGFENVVAPFDGVITARNTDVGALIDSGAAGTAGSTGSTPKQLFHMASLGTMRVYVAVPEVYAADVAAGTTAYLTLDEYPGRHFEGTIARNSNSIDPTTRTLNVEVDVANPNRELLPGAYVFVHFHISGNHVDSVTIPSNTLLFRSEGLRVGVVSTLR